MKHSSDADLRKALTEAARQAFTELRNAHRDETFYAFSIYTTPDGTYAVPTANSEEGLRRKAEEYRRRGSGSVAENLKSLRWNPADWAHHGVGEEHFSEAEKLLDARPEQEDLDDAEDEAMQRIQIFVDALKPLDKEGFFGKGKARENIVLLVTMGDQDEQLLLDCAKQLNPPSVYNKFSQPFLHRTTGKFRHVGSRKVYETLGAALSRDGKLIATAGDATVLAWSLPGFKEVLRKRCGEISVWDVAVSPDGKTVALGSSSAIDDEEGGFELWNVPKQKREFAWNGAKGNVSAVRFSPDGSVLACGGDDSMIRLWDVKTRKPLRKWKAHRGSVTSLCFSPDGTQLFSTDGAEGIHICDVATARKRGSIRDAGDRIALSHDGTFLAVAPGYGKRKDVVRIWDVATKKLACAINVPAKSQWKPRKYADDGYSISAVAFSHDGRRLAVAASWPGFASLWDWRKEKERLVLDPGGYECFEAITFLTDGKSVAVTGRGFSQPPLIVWDISQAR